MKLKPNTFQPVFKYLERNTFIIFLMFFVKYVTGTCGPKSLPCSWNVIYMIQEAYQILPCTLRILTIIWSYRTK